MIDEIFGIKDLGIFITKLFGHICRMEDQRRVKTDAGNG